MGKQVERVPVPACWRCDKYYHYCETVTKYQHGVTMYLGDRFCLAGKRARKFRARDPKQKPPAWCPKRKTPCELRVYRFLDEETRQMQTFFAGLRGSDLAPTKSAYGVCFEGTTEWTPRRFWEICNQYGAELKLPVAVEPFDVVEIDDGLQPVCFYRTYAGFRLLHKYDFDTKDARKRTSTLRKEKENDGNDRAEDPVS